MKEEYVYNGHRYRIRQLADTWYLIRVPAYGDDFYPPLEINDTGAMIFARICDGETVEAISAKIAEQEDISYEIIYRDIHAFAERIKEIYG